MSLQQYVESFAFVVPCPFCGSSRIGFRYPDRPNYWLTCTDCGADGPVVSKKIKDPEPKALLLWNRRKLLQLGE